jgi:hypothetical protein
MLDKLGIGIIIGFIFISLTFLFSTVFVQQIGSEYILKEGVQALNNTANLIDIDQTSKNIINNIEPEYNNINIPYDLGFLIILVVSLIISFSITFKAENLSIFSFYGALTLGMIMFLFTLGIVESLTNWFYTNIIFGFLEFDMYAYAPLMAGFIDNLNIFAFLWALGLLLVNRFSLNLPDKLGTQQGGFEP